MPCLVRQAVGCADLALNPRNLKKMNMGVSSVMTRGCRLLVSLGFLYFSCSDPEML